MKPHKLKYSIENISYQINSSHSEGILIYKFKRNLLSRTRAEKCHFPQKQCVKVSDYAPL